MRGLIRTSVLAAAAPAAKPLPPARTGPLEHPGLKQRLCGSSLSAPGGSLVQPRARALRTRTLKLASLIPDWTPPAARQQERFCWLRWQLEMALQWYAAGSGADSLQGQKLPLASSGTRLG